MAEEVVGVTGGHPGAEGEVGAVADQAEAGEELRGAAEEWETAGEEQGSEGEEGAPEGAAPGDEEGVGVGGNVGTGEAEEGEGEVSDVAAGGQGVEDVAELVEAIMARKAG